MDGPAEGQGVPIRGSEVGSMGRRGRRGTRRGRSGLGRRVAWKGAAGPRQKRGTGRRKERMVSGVELKGWWFGGAADGRERQWMQYFSLEAEWRERNWNTGSIKPSPRGNGLEASASLRARVCSQCNARRRAPKGGHRLRPGWSAGRDQNGGQNPPGGPLRHRTGGSLAVGWIFPDASEPLLIMHPG